MGILSVFMVWVMSMGNVFATSEPVTDVKMINPEIYQQPTITYNISDEVINSISTKNSTLLKLECDTNKIMKSLWFNGKEKIFSIWLEQNWYDVTYDMKSCSLWGNKTNYNYNNELKALSEEQAINFVNKFLASKMLDWKIYNKLWKPVIMYKNSNGRYPIVAYDAKTMNAWTMNQMEKQTISDDIEIDDSNVEEVTKDYYSYTILVPYTISWKEIYNQYWTKNWITFEVTADWVNSFYTNMLAIKGVKKTSTVINKEQLKKIIKNWWNSPYYGMNQKDETINLSKIDKAYVLFNLWKNNTNELYLSTATKIESDVKMPYQDENYTQIISDYVIWNTDLEYNY